MSTVTIYQFTGYVITEGQSVLSPGWGTRKAIEERKCHVLEKTAVEVEASLVDSDEPGLTARGFDPHAFSRPTRA